MNLRGGPMKRKFEPKFEAREQDGLSRQDQERIDNLIRLGILWSATSSEDCLMDDCPRCGDPTLPENVDDGPAWGTEGWGL